MASGAYGWRSHPYYSQPIKYGEIGGFPQVRALLARALIVARERVMAYSFPTCFAGGHLQSSESQFALFVWKRAEQLSMRGSAALNTRLRDFARERLG
jgi:hypothetical protein